MKQVWKLVALLLVPSTALAGLKPAFILYDTEVDFSGTKTNGHVVTYNSSTNKFTLQASSGGGGSVAFAVEEGLTEKVSPTTYLNFDSTDFNITNSGSGRAGIAFDKLSVSKFYDASQAKGDLAVMGAAQWGRLGRGTNGQIFISDDSLTNRVGWASLGGDVSGSVTDTQVTDFTLSGQATGDLAYFNGSNWVVRAAGTQGQALHIDGGVPVWSTDVAGIGIARGGVLLATVANTLSWDASEFGQAESPSGNVSTTIDKVFAIDGSAAAPSYSYESDRTMGRFRGGAYEGVSIAGVLEEALYASGLWVTDTVSGSTLVQRDASATAEAINLTGQATGTLLYYSGGWIPFGVGANHQLLITQGAGSDPAWLNLASLLTATNGVSFTGTTDLTLAAKLSSPFVFDASGNVSLTFDTAAGFSLNASGLTLDQLAVSRLKASDAARGGLIRRGASAWETVALGSSGQVVASDGTDTVFTSVGGDVSGPITALTVTSFTFPGQADGDVLWRNGTSWEVLHIGTPGQVLKVSAGDVVWGTDLTGGGGGAGLDFTRGGVLFVTAATTATWDAAEFGQAESPTGNVSTTIDRVFTLDGSGAAPTYSYESARTTGRFLGGSFEGMVLAGSLEEAIYASGLWVTDTVSASSVVQRNGSALADAVNLTGQAQGEFLYYSSGWKRWPVGTNHQLLSTGGAAAEPAWLNLASLLTATNGVSFTGTTDLTLAAKLSSPFVFDASGNVSLTYSTGIDVENGALVVDQVPIARLQASDAARGGLIRRGASAWETVALGSSGQVVASNGTDTVFASVGGDASGAITALTVTDLTMTSETTGSLLYFDGANWVVRNPGTNGQVLKLSGGVPTWGTDSTGGGGSGLDMSRGGVLFVTAATTQSWDAAEFGQAESPSGNVSTTIDKVFALDGSSAAPAYSYETARDTGRFLGGGFEGMALAGSLEEAIYASGLWVTDTVSGSVLVQRDASATASAVNVTGQDTGTLLTYNAGWKPFAVGTNHQLLITQGAGSDPSWLNIASLLTATNGVSFTGTTDLTLAAKLSSPFVFDASGNVSLTYSTGIDVENGALVVDQVPVARLQASDAARGGLIRRGASAWETVALGSAGQVVASNGTDTVFASAGGDVSGQITALAVTDLSFAGEANGDLAYRSGGVWGGLPIGTNGKVLTSNGTIPGWTALSGDVSGSIGATTVTDLTMASEAQGAVLYFNGTNWVVLGPGTSGQFLKTNGAGANPAWAAAAGGGGTSKVFSVAYDSQGVQNSAAATDFNATGQIPANTLTAGGILQLRGGGLFTTRNTTTSGEPLTLQVKYGSTTVAFFPMTLGPSATSQGWDFDMEATVRSVGGSGTIVRIGNATARGIVTNTLLDTITCTGSATPITIDTTANTSITVNAQWGNADVSNSITQTHLTAVFLP